MTSPTTVARAVARDAERRARQALDTVVAAHTALRDADTALAAAQQARAEAGPGLARAIAAARAVGITDEHLAELGVTVPSARTLRRRTADSASPTPAPRPSADIPDGHHPHPTQATSW